jgi:hypothetical protein
MSISNLLQTNDFVQRNNAKALASKWERTGLLEGIKTETERAGMAQLLENQARQLVKEASSTGVAAGSEEWAGVALPLVRRIFAEFAAKEFVSVQPMNLPSGLIFYLDFKYGTAQPGFDDDNLNRTGDPFSSPNALDSLFGVTTTGSDAAGLEEPPKPKKLPKVLPRPPRDFVSEPAFAEADKSLSSFSNLSNSPKSIFIDPVADFFLSFISKRFNKNMISLCELYIGVPDINNNFIPSAACSTLIRLGVNFFPACDSLISISPPGLSTFSSADSAGLSRRLCASSIITRRPLNSLRRIRSR